MRNDREALARLRTDSRGKDATMGINTSKGRLSIAELLLHGSTGTEYSRFGEETGKLPAQIKINLDVPTRPRHCTDQGPSTTKSTPRPPSVVSRPRRPRSFQAPGAASM